MVMQGGDDDHHEYFSSVCQHCGQDDDGMVRLGHCRHVVCLTCLKAPHMNKALPPAEPIRCPVQDCKRPLLVASDVLHILTPTSYDHYNRNQLKTFVDRMESCAEGKEGALACPQCSGSPGNGEKQAPSTSTGAESSSDQASLAAASKSTSPAAAASDNKKKRDRGGGRKKGEGAAAAAAAVAVEEEEDTVVAKEDESSLLPRPQECGFCSIAYCPMCSMTAPLKPKIAAWIDQHATTCPRLQLYRIQELSQATEQLLEKQRGHTDGHRGEKKKERKSFLPFTTAWVQGTGFGGAYLFGKDGVTAAELNAKEKQAKEDTSIKELLERWAALLPSSTQMPILPEVHALVGGPFRESLPITTPLARLLRLLLLNDSLFDVAKRKEMYTAVLDVLAKLSIHPLIAPVVTKAVEEKIEEGEDDGGMSSPQQDDRRQVSDPADGCLLKLLQKLQMQAKVFQRTGGHTNVGEADAEGFIKDMAFSTKISDTFDAISRRVQDAQANHRFGFKTYRAIEGKLGEAEATALEATPRKNGKGGGGGRPITTAENAAAAVKGNELHEQYIKVMSDLKFYSAPLLEMVEKEEITYAFQNAASKAQAHKGMIRIMQEVSSLTTSLPVEYSSGIYVRCDESRPDVIKALIIGPEGTPYWNGIFEFDVYLPPNYPNVPPQVRLKTTNGNTFKFNPNLYSNGKVCLSLLGTWMFGPGWDPKRSTLLQVLVSIQSMILVPDPFYNEPGWELLPSGGAPELYNKSIRNGTLQYAILDQIKAAKSGKSPLWKDMILKHFALKKDEVMTQCDDWAIKNAGGWVAALAGAIGSMLTSASNSPSQETKELLSDVKDVETWLK